MSSLQDPVTPSSGTERPRSAAGLLERIGALAMEHSPASTNGKTATGGTLMPSTPVSGDHHVMNDPAIVNLTKPGDKSGHGPDHANADPSPSATSKEATSGSVFDAGFVAGLALGRAQRNDPFTQTPAPVTPQHNVAADSDAAFATPEFTCNGDDAQAWLSPAACVFIANLNAACTDAELQSAVLAHFTQYGHCYIKVKRDNRNMPFAFLQYKDAAAAHAAILEGNGAFIAGRTCRVEKANCPRSLYLTRILGGQISRADVAEILGNYGPFEKIWYPTDTEKTAFKLPEGVFVTFEYYQRAVDARNAFCASTRYRLEELDDAGHLHSGKKHRQPHELPVSDYPGAIWVGNVPVHAIERDIARVFAAYGEIAKVEMPRPRFGENHDSDIKYAYVYFRYPEAAHRAQRGHETLFGRVLNVQPRRARCVSPISGPSARFGDEQPWYRYPSRGFGADSYSPIPRGMGNPYGRRSLRSSDVYGPHVPGNSFGNCGPYRQPYGPTEGYTSTYQAGAGLNYAEDPFAPPYTRPVNYYQGAPVLGDHATNEMMTLAGVAPPVHISGRPNELDTAPVGARVDGPVTAADNSTPPEYPGPDGEGGSKRKKSKNILTVYPEDAEDVLEEAYQESEYGQPADAGTFPEPGAVPSTEHPEGS